MEGKGSDLKQVLRLCGIVLAIAAVIALCVILFPYVKLLGQAGWLTSILEKITGFFADTGVVVNIIVLTVLQIVQMLLALIPGAPISVAMGVAFGSFWGTVLNIVSTVLGTWLIVWCVEKFGMRFVNKFMNSKGFEKLTFLHTASKRNALLFLLFLIPGTPKDLITFFAPFTGAKPGTIVLASLARIPSIILMVMVGSSISTNQYEVTMVVLTVAAVAALAGMLIRDKFFPSKAKRRMQRKNTVIFDLDGTLLDTLGDLTDAVNYALGQNGCPGGYPLRTREEIRSFIGNGIRKLVERALPEGVGEDEVESALQSFKEYYEAHMTDRTAPYEGIPELLETLREAGYRLAIVSNKADFAVQRLREHYFADMIPLAIGEIPGQLPRKPQPDSLLAAMERLGSAPEETVYVGDSPVDIETARNAGIDCISVTWGFCSVGTLVAKGAAVTAKAPGEVAEMLARD